MNVLMNPSLVNAVVLENERFYSFRRSTTRLARVFLGPALVVGKGKGKTPQWRTLNNLIMDGA